MPIPAVLKEVGSALAVPQLLIIILLLDSMLLSGLLVAHLVWVLSVKWTKLAMTYM